MPEMRIILDAEQDALPSLAELHRRYPLLAQPSDLAQAGHLIHLDGTAPIDVGALPRGMRSGEPSIAFCFRLPNRKVVLAETSLRLFLTAADGFKARYGDPRMADLSMPDITLPPDFPPLALIRAARQTVQLARDGVSGEAFDQLQHIHALLEQVEDAGGIPPAPEEWTTPS